MVGENNGNNTGAHLQVRDQAACESRLQYFRAHPDEYSKTLTQWCSQSSNPGDTGPQ
jgi:hypothetical protein